MIREPDEDASRDRDDHPHEIHPPGPRPLAEAPSSTRDLRDPRDLRDLRDLRGGTAMRELARIRTVGPYTIGDDIVRAPAAWLVEGRDAGGARVILQLARCRAVRNEAERVERGYFEARVAELTSVVATEPDVTILGHGAVDDGDGTRLLYWVLPWSEGARAIASAPLVVRSPEALVEVGLALADRLARRHALGRIEPLLSEHLVFVRPEERSADLLGAPIHLSPGWLEPDMVPMRLAPEEFLSGTPRESGDVWRLGQALFALAETIEPAPAEVSACLERLTHSDPTRRIPRATEVLVELQSLRGALEDGATLLSDDPVDNTVETVRLDSLPSDVIASLLLQSAADSGRFEATTPFEVVGVEPAPRAAPPETGAIDEPHGTATTGETVNMRPDPISPADDDGENGEETTLVPPLFEEAPAMRSAARPGATGDGRRAESAPRGAAELAFSPFVEDLRLGDQPARPRDPFPRTERTRNDLDLRALAAERRPRRSIGPLLGLLTVLGALLAFVRANGPGVPRFLATPANDVLLEANVPHATVISEADGRVLGETPMRFLVPPGLEARVIVAAEGWEPQRAVLPERGRLITALTPLPKGRDVSCRVALAAPREAALEGVVGDVHVDGGFRIPGAAVVRATRGQGVDGAWIVRCPVLGGQYDQELEPRPSRGLAEIEVRAPAGATLYVDGEAAGTVPARHPTVAAFAAIRVEDGRGATAERFVAIAPDLAIEMPDPAAELARE